MALSNIFREPRREITETVVGVGVIFTMGFIPIYADYRFACWFERATYSTGDGDCPWPLGMFFGVVALAALVVLVILLATAVAGIHKFGDTICNALQNRGIHLRPRQRY